MWPGLKRKLIEFLHIVVWHMRVSTRLLEVMWLEYGWSLETEQLVATGGAIIVHHFHNIIMSDVHHIHLKVMTFQREQLVFSLWNGIRNEDLFTFYTMLVKHSPSSPQWDGRLIKKIWQGLGYLEKNVFRVVKKEKKLWLFMPLPPDE